VAERVVTTNSVRHASSEIDLSPQIAAIVADVAGA